MNYAEAVVEEEFADKYSEAGDALTEVYAGGPLTSPNLAKQALLQVDSGYGNKRAGTNRSINLNLILSPLSIVSWRNHLESYNLR